MEVTFFKMCICYSATCCYTELASFHTKLVNGCNHSSARMVTALEGPVTHFRSRAQLWFKMLLVVELQSKCWSKPKQGTFSFIGSAMISSVKHFIFVFLIMITFLIVCLAIFLLE
ncbi:hypothetical protein FKM82_001517 [Ascaphus truei]